MPDFTLTEEQRNIRELAHDFAEKEIRPVAWDYDRDATWPREIIDKAWEAGADEPPASRAVRRHGRVLFRRRPDRRGARVGLRRDRYHNRNQRASGDAGAARRLRADQGQVPRHAQRAAQARLLLPDRARGRLGRVGHANHRCAQARQVRDQRLEGLHQQRRLRRLVHRLRQDRQGRRPPRHLGVPGPARRHGHGRQARGQDGAARIEYGGDQLQRDRGARRAPARRREPRLQAGDDDPGPQPPRRRRDGYRHRPSGIRVRHRVLEAANPVRCTDRHAPGDPVHDRRHGHRDRGRPPADLAVGACCSTRASATPCSPRTPSASPPTRR